MQIGYRAVGGFRLGIEQNGINIALATDRYTARTESGVDRVHDPWHGPCKDWRGEIEKDSL